MTVTNKVNYAYIIYKSLYSETNCYSINSLNENRAYVHEIHLFILQYVSPLLFKNLEICMRFSMKFSAATI